METSQPPGQGRRVDVKLIVWQAAQFLAAARKCLPPDLADGIWDGPGVPGVVCAAFGVELWLKALHYQLNADAGVPGGHDLRKLFHLLPAEMRKEVVGACSYSAADFEDALLLDARVFINWRYGYEHALGSAEPMEPLTADIRLLFELAGACERVLRRLT